MGGDKRSCLLRHLHFLTHIVLVSTRFLAAAENIRVPALYVFGDSYVDPGNNNYISTPVKANYPPYGIDFIDHKATGRSSNARLVPDFLVSYLGIKQLEPPYLDPKLSIEELKTGVSFASANTGFDPLTAATTHVIVMKKQAELFGEYKTKLEAAIGKIATEDITRNALYFVNCGINDIANNYFRYPTQPLKYTIEEYEQFLINLFREFVQMLLDQGARKFAVAGVPPLGCLPTIIDMYSKNPKIDRRCIENVTAAGRGFNQLLQDELKLLQTMYEDVGAKFIYLDQDQPVSTLLLNPNQYGFVDEHDACCRSKSGLCLPGSLSRVCPDRLKYLFWDVVHLTEKGFSFVFESYRPNIDIITSA